MRLRYVIKWWNELCTLTLFLNTVLVIIVQQILPLQILSSFYCKYGDLIYNERTYHPIPFRIRNCNKWCAIRKRCSYVALTMHCCITVSHSVSFHNRVDSCVDQRRKCNFTDAQKMLYKSHQMKSRVWCFTAVACPLPQDGAHETPRFHGIVSGGMATINFPRVMRNNRVSHLVKGEKVKKSHFYKNRVLQ